MEYGGVKLTEEQAFAVECMGSRGDTKVQAPAGSGKTFILKAGSNELGSNGLRGSYLAFNKAIADYAKATFPGNVECRTGHSLAFGSVGRKYAHRLSPLPGFKLANEYDIGNTRKFPTKTAKGYLILDTIRNFCYSRDPELESKHIPYIKDKITDVDTLEYIYQDIPIQANKIMGLMMNEKEDIPISHDLYLKMWALSSPRIPKDFLLFDEAQDANPVILGVMEEQEHMQKIFVGDRYQQIYGWRGARNAMTSVRAEHTAVLSQSFRFGQAIADVANSILNGYNPSILNGHIPINGETDHTLVKIKGNPNQDSKVEPITGCPDAIICRTNGSVIANVFKYIGKHKIFIQGGPQSLISLIKGAQALKAGRKTSVQDLALFNNWDEVLEYSKASADGKSLGVLIKLMENYGGDALLSLVEQTEKTARTAELTVTTGHKAKGLEWNKVKLADDFFYPTKKDSVLPSGEVNVLYVSATRALKVLDISECIAANVDYVLKNQE